MLLVISFDPKNSWNDYFEKLKISFKRKYNDEPITEILKYFVKKISLTILKEKYQIGVVMKL